MSYEGLLTHRCSVLRLETTDSDGAPSYAWTTVATNVPCRADLSFQRGGRPAGWRPEPGRPADRQGTMFFLTGVDVKPGDRLPMTRGPSGVFEVDGTVDQVPGIEGIHHVECGISEVAQPLGRS